MKKAFLSLLVFALALGQAPAWAMACGKPNSLACVKVCAQAQDRWTQGGKLDTLGQATMRIQVREAAPSLAAASAAPIAAPAGETYAVFAAAAGPVSSALPAARAHAPPSLRPAQVLLSVPSSQAPPASV
jgi:hypothetical protein